MKKNYLLTLLLALLFAFIPQFTQAQAPVATPKEAITGLLNRIGGNGAADKFEIVIDASLAENGKDVFVITSQNGKPCIKGNTQLSVATGINWYLNHYAHINLTWNNLTTDLMSATLPVPGSEEKHVCNTTYRYNFNTCTFSYSMAFWTWERWQQEIDWMALHGVNAPLNLVGLDVVTRKFLEELGVSESDIDAYIAGPGFIAWFAMNNLEGWGGTINSSSTGVQMNGNPDWWYTRQEQLCRDMLQRMRELGMQPVIPGFSGQIPNSLSNYSISGFSSSDVINGGTWAGGYTRPDILKPFTNSYKKLASVYYKHLEDVMGVSEFYSMDPFHEGNSLPSGITADNTWPKIMAELDNYYVKVSKENLTKYSAPEKPKWIIQKWQSLPPGNVFSTMSGYPEYKERFIGLDLFADNIYAGNAAFWQGQFYAGCPYVYCMLHNFGGRSGMHGRLETTMDGYFQALAKGNNCQGIGATPEGIETNPILYDMLFELPWMDPAKRPTADEWLADYAHARYGVDNKTAPKALSALKNLKKSVWDCKVNQQGTSEAVILARPNWTVGSVSSWSTSAIYWDTQDVLQAADELSAIKDVVTANGGQDGIANYNYDFIDVVRQSMVDYAAQLLPLINAARGNDAEYTRLYQLYLQLMLDLDEMLSYDENFKLERWTSLARNIADEVSGTTENDRNWLEWNARTQITVWADTDKDLHDYSNRCWAGLIKDFHYKRWEKFFTTKGGSFEKGWFNGFEYPWTVDFNNTYNLAGDYSEIVIPTDMTATEKAVETFGKYFGRVKGATKNYIFPMGVARKATASDVIPEVYRGQTVDLPLEIGKNVTISSVWVDLNNDGAKGNGETLTANNNQVDIPADAAIGKTTAQVVYSDGTDITFSLALVEDITDERTVTVVAGSTNGSVAIEGTNELSIKNAEAVKMTATANPGYNFANWTDANSNVVSNDNPFIYYGKEDATFTANFIQDKWGVPTEDKSDWGEALVKTSFVNELTFAYYNREPETIYEASAAPDNLFNTIPQIINVPQGASFDVTWSDNGDNGLKFCCLSAYIDLNADGDFTDEGELVKVAGTKGSQNTTACEGKINVLLPYDAPLGITHMRIRFDGAWKDNGYNATTKSYDAKAQLNRMCYELIINVTEGSAKAAHVVVESNNDAWGAAEVWTDETPGWTASNEWDVSASIPVHIKAIKSSEDVEFLGWYDHYGRLLTENLEHTMYAREDATYTAKFRKALDIDGWVFEYRTEPGSEVTHYSTTALANGVAPTAGKKYYIAAHTKSGGVYYNRYLYDNSGKLATSTSVPANCVWTCIDNGDNTFSFQNESGNYLADSNNTNRYLSIGATAAKYTFADPTHEGVTLKNAASYEGGKCMVTKADGTDFNRYTDPANDGSWSSDYLFFEGITPDVVILTSVRQSGDHDLDIPETVEIMGEQCKIVGFDNNVFKNNKDLWSISLPQTIEFLSEKSLLNGTMTGAITPGAGRENTEDYTVYTLPNKIVASDGFKITVKGITNGNCFNQWGSGLFATGTNPLLPAYQGGFQFYLAKDGSFVIKVNNSKDADKTTISDCKAVADKEFTAIITYKSGTVIINIDNGNGQSATHTKDCTLNDISAFSAAIPIGITLNVNVEPNKEANPFSGCSNLDKIAFNGTCANYYVNGEGDLYNSSDVLVCSPEGKAKGADRRELAVLIDKMKSLTAQVATYDPIGKENKIALQTTKDQPYYMWCNAPQSGDEGLISNLLDSNGGTFFHSNWGSTTAPADGLDHHFTIELGDENAIKNFKFYYKARSGSGLGDYPTTIKVQGSNDGTNYSDVQIVEPRNANGGTIENGNTWTSDVLTDGTAYEYLRFMVTATTTNKNKDGHIYFHMADFELYKMTSTATLYKMFEGSYLTSDFASEKYDVLLNAINVFNNATTVDQINTAKTDLQTAYDALKAKIAEVIPVEFTVDEKNPVLYKIFIKRTADVTVLSWDNNDAMVAVGNKADNTTWQAWYFMSSTNGVTIHPYNADGKVLSADNTGNAPAKVWAVEKGEKSFYEWLFVKQSDGYFNIQAHDKSNYFSNNGGVNNKMGFWKTDPHSDGGSLFKFEKAEFTDNNPRFYQLSDVKGTLTDGTNVYEGTSVGLYTGGKEYREAYTAATALVTAGSATSSSDACYDAYKTLRETHAALKYNDADESKYYIIKSVANNAYCKGKLVRTSYEPATHDGSPSKYDHRHLVFDASENIPAKTLAIFQLVKTGTKGEFKIKNLHTGLHVKSFQKDAEHMGDLNNAQPVVIAGYEDGAVTLKVKDAEKPMHAQDDYDVIVTWDASSGNASTWSVEEIAESEISYNANISSVGYSTLFLNYPVAIPDGVDAYTASEVEEDWLKMEALNDVIPANTAVVLKGDAGTYNFKLAKEPRTVVETIFTGTLYKQTITKESGAYYVLAYIDTTPNDDIDNKEVGFYNAVNGTNANEFINAANKAYLHIPGTTNAKFYGFRFENGETTGINGVKDQSSENYTIYDLQGRKVNNPTKGLYIINGKKVYIK